MADYKDLTPWTTDKYKKNWSNRRGYTMSGGTGSFLNDPMLRTNAIRLKKTPLENGRSNGTSTWFGDMNSEISSLVTRLLHQCVNWGYSFKEKTSLFLTNSFSISGTTGEVSGSISHFFGIGFDMPEMYQKKGDDWYGKKVSDVPADVITLMTNWGFKHRGDRHFEFMYDQASCAAKAQEARDKKLGEPGNVQISPEGDRPEDYGTPNGTGMPGEDTTDTVPTAQDVGVVYYNSADANRYYQNPPFDKRLHGQGGGKGEQAWGRPARGFIATNNMPPEAGEEGKPPREGARLNFLYNPSQLSISHTVDSSNDPNVVDTMDATGGATPMAVTGAVGVSLLFDRTYELWDKSQRGVYNAQTGEWQKKAGDTGEDGAYGSPAGIGGVWTDINALYNITGLNLKMGKPSQGLGFLNTAYTVYLFLGGPNTLWYYGYIDNVSILYTHWAYDMIPMRAKADISLQLIPGSNITGYSPYRSMREGALQAPIIVANGGRENVNVLQTADLRGARMYG